MASDEPNRHRFGVRAFVALALPMIVSRAGLAAMGIADGVMVSRFDPKNFAALSLAEGTLGRLLDVCVAFLIGGLSLVPRAFALGDSPGAKMIWRRTLPISIVLGFVGIAGGLVGRSILRFAGQTPELSGSAGPVMTILGWGYPAALLAMAAAIYLEGINRPRFVAAAVIAANVLNILFNWVLIGGHLGIPAMGARGSALSTTIVRCVLGVVLVGIAWISRDPGNVDITDAQRVERRASRRAQWKLGLGAAGGTAVMVLLGSSLILFAGRLGLMPLAAFSAGWNLAGPAMLLALGMADAAGVFVSAESGRGTPRTAAVVGWSSLRLALLVIAFVAITLLLFSTDLARLYTKDQVMRDSIISVLPLVALIVMIDTAGFVMVSSLRGIRDMVWPIAIDVIAMVLLVPIAAGLSFRIGLGVRGLFLAMLIAGAFRAASLTARFFWQTRSHDVNPSVVASLET